jgi:hypothetical protein
VLLGGRNAVKGGRVGSCAEELQAVNRTVELNEMMMVVVRLERDGEGGRRGTKDEYGAGEALESRGRSAVT